MQVCLLTYTAEPLRTLWTATRTCRSPKKPTELWIEYPGDASALKLLRNIWKAGHQSVFEHVTLTFAVSSVSRVLLAQYTRHRIGVSVSVQSARSVPYDLESVSTLFHTPETLCSNKNATEDIVMHTLQFYKQLLELGVPREDARYVLPQGCLVNFVTSLNLRSLWDVYTKRVKVPGAQKEIKEMVSTMMYVATEELPWLKQLYELTPLNDGRREV